MNTNKEIEILSAIQHLIECYDNHYTLNDDDFSIQEVRVNIIPSLIIEMFEDLTENEINFVRESIDKTFNDFGFVLLDKERFEYLTDVWHSGDSIRNSLMQRNNIPDDISLHRFVGVSFVDYSYIAFKNIPVFAKTLY